LLVVVELFEFCGDEIVNPPATISGTRTKTGNDEPIMIRDELLTTAVLLGFSTVPLTLVAYVVLVSAEEAALAY
jgi:hypothetical protein